VGEGKSREFKLTDISFGVSIKFWLAFLVVQIIVMVVVLGIMFVFMITFYTTMRELISIPTPTALSLLCLG
jgi:hypothetical protein